jgi:hypothetical protein
VVGRTIDRASSPQIHEESPEEVPVHERDRAAEEHADEEREPLVPPALVDQLPGDQGPKGAHGSIGEVDDTRRPEEHHEAHPREGEHASQRQSQHDERLQIRHLRPPREP